MMTSCLIVFLAGLHAVQDAPAPDPVSELPETIRAISPERIQATVDHLADDEYFGRYWLSPFGRKAAEWIGDRFKDAGCEPVMPEESWFQELTTKDASPNVVAMIRGTDPDAGFVLLGAHYDHLPPRRPSRRGNRDTIYNGADDNASGVAGIIEVAKALAPIREQLRASVLLIAFTGEEAGLKGARFFVNNPPVPLESMRGLFNLDMISRGERDVIFIDGASGAPQLMTALEKANEAVGLRLMIDKHPDWLSRSDQWPFLQKNIPAMLFSVEDHEDYHEVSDHADRIIAPLAADVSRLVALATLDIAGRTDKKAPLPAEEDTPDMTESVPSDPPAVIPNAGGGKEPS